VARKPPASPPSPPDAAATTVAPRLPGRRTEAARNDLVILEAAREVFIADPRAPIAAVAERAGVGISALYRRYGSKELLLRKLCHDGLRRFIDEATAADAEPDGWEAFARFMRGVVDADVHSLTVHLAGTFTPTPEMSADARRAGVLAAGLMERARRSGQLRDGVVAEDITLTLEACAAVRVPHAERTAQLRRRQLAVILDGLRSRAGQAGLPGPAPVGDEVNWRWSGSR
jgi:AcrR family transcriptional regulator